MRVRNSDLTSEYAHYSNIYIYLFIFVFVAYFCYFFNIDLLLLFNI